MEIGSAYPLEEKMTMEIKGRHLIEGVPKTITITDEEIREALTETVNVIVDAVRVALERTPPELSADIVDRGIVLTGGGSMLKNLDKRLREETGLPLAMAEDPLSSVVLGAGKMLSDFNLLQENIDRLTAGPRRPAQVYGIARHPTANRLALHGRGGRTHPADLHASQHAARRSRPRGADLRRLRRSAARDLVRDRIGARRVAELLRTAADPPENEALRTEVAQLRVGLQQERGTGRAVADAAEAARHEDGDAARDDGGVRSSPAAASPDFRTVTIDKGTGGGLRPDMAVISPAGVVGRIILPTGRAAKVQLLIDRDAAAGAVTERSRAQGVVVGTGTSLRLDHVPGTADIKVGDRVVTSGIEGIYPKGFEIGQIESIRSSRRRVQRRYHSSDRGILVARSRARGVDAASRRIWSGDGGCQRPSRR